MKNKIISAESNGATWEYMRYWTVLLENGKKPPIKAVMHDMAYKLLRFEQTLLKRKRVTIGDLAVLGELHRDVFEHERAMEECD
jgi:hypothetical protein